MHHSRQTIPLQWYMSANFFSSGCTQDTTTAMMKAGLIITLRGHKIMGGDHFNSGAESSYMWSMTLRRLLRLLHRARISFVLLPILLWILLGEFGAFYFYSLRWFWPSASTALSSRAVKQCLKDGDQYCHVSRQDAIYFPESFNTSSSFRQKSLSELKMLVLSDPHIMCTYE